mgnify:CR=1 FL=1
MKEQRGCQLSWSRATPHKTQVHTLPLLHTQVTLPPVQPEVPPPQFGFVDNAERINSRACMIGFFALLALEGVTKTGLLDMLGFVTGQGLGFEL